MEAYAEYALRAWLAGEHAVSPRTRRFAKWSAMVSFALGMTGQVTYHLLAGAGITRALWAVTTIVSCLPVLVLAMGTALAHLLHDDAAARASGQGTAGPGRLTAGPPAGYPGHPASTGPDQVAAAGPAMPDLPTAARPPTARVHPTAGHVPGPDPQAEQSAVEHARLLARRLAVAGKPVSRRTVRSGGIRGSNEALNRLARELNAELASRLR